MREDLHREVTRRLLGDFGFKEKGQWLQEGKCPDCGKRELFAKADSPWLVRCGREHKCGTQIHIKDHYPDLFDDWSKRYPVTAESPTAAADAYLTGARGFSLARLHGTYTQEHYYNREIKAGSATVRFALACGSWWERIIDQPQRFGKRKANFAFGKPYHGHWWQLPDSAGDAAEIWLVEGIFDAIALELNGLTARGLLSSNNYPEHALAALAAACRAEGRDKPVLIWALDGDASGRGYTLKWVERARREGWECQAAQIPQDGRGKVDWNDAHQRGRLGAKDLDEYRYQGALLIAHSAVEKAMLIYNRQEQREFHFGHRNRLYWWALDVDRFNKAMREAEERKDDGRTHAQMREAALHASGALTVLANCYPTPLYYQANRLTDEAWYYYRIEFPHGGAPVKNTFTAAQLSGSSEFKKRLLAVAAGAIYTGTTLQLDRILRTTVDNIKTVETVDFIGYSREHGAYVFGDIAVRGGVVHAINDEDYFELGRRLSLKSLNQSVALSINTLPDDYREDWLEMVWQSFGGQGLVALAFWFGSLFAEQIRAEQKSYPFLEIIGEAGSGKSTLIEFLWKLVGRRDYEGFDPSKSTAAARARNFAQVSNLPVVLIEADREEDTSKARTFDWNELKTAYNGRSVRATGVKNSGNETREPPFRGSIVISQNAEVNSSDAILQRLVHLRFDKGAHTPATKQLAETLERMPVEHVSGFVLRAVKREADVLAVLAERTPRYTDQLLAVPEIKSVRIAKNHAQMMALLDALRLVLPLSDHQHQATQRLLVQLAIQRQQAINADHPVVQAFWELFEYLESHEPPRNGKKADTDTEFPRSLDHSRNADLIAINLVEMEARAALFHLRLPGGDTLQLKRHLRTSRVPRYQGTKTVNSINSTAQTPRSVRCWVFERRKSP